MDTKVTPVHRVALVTGAARGIGRATVVIFYGQGYSVVAVHSCGGLLSGPFKSTPEIIVAVVEFSF